ncbi:ESF1 homolog [Haliotis cracherodii]|uniref:ESF1 homolog n=1 Tax=Haliotis cracherodii TaxID=6455 RepID=UPI0039EA1B1F
MDDIRKDERFAHIVKDPRFRTMPKNKKRVKIDKRFQSMFTDKKFKLKYSVDKRGRPIQFTTNENLRKYYELSDNDEGDSADEDEGDSDGSDEESKMIAKLQKKVETKSKSTHRKETKAKKTNGTKREQSTSSVKHASTKKKKMSRQPSSEEELDQSEEESSEDNLNVSKGNQKKVIRSVNKTDIVDEVSSDDDDDEDDDDDDSDDESGDLGDSVPKVGADEPDYARGEGLIESSTDDDDDDDDELEEEDDGFDHKWGELDKGVPEAEELSHRLAICNMDWDRIKAVDLFVLLNSFKPSHGVINSIRIYPSEFGLQRLKEEEMYGPTELKESGQEVDVDEERQEDENEESPYHREKLRQYQLNRLKYYYAVLECDSVATASKIYDECDGMEYETSSARMDLRYIPDDMTFDEPIKNECLTLPDASAYKPPAFFTSALCQSKVNLTWDETDQDRVKVTMKKMDKNGEINEDDFKAYLASSSEDEAQGYGGPIAQSDESDEFSDEDRQIEKYKNLLKDIDESSNRKGDMEMEIEWEPGLKDTTDDIVKTKKKTKDQTPWEEYQQRKKEKKKQKREEMKKVRLDKKEGRSGEKAFSDDELPADLADSFFTDALSSGKLVSSKKKKKKKGKKDLTEEEQEMLKKDQAELSLLMMDEEDGSRHFNLGDLVVEKKKKKKKKRQEEDMQQKKGDDFEIDMNDSRFGAIFDSHMFNIDPSAPEFKKTKGMEAIIQEKLKRRKIDGGGSERKKAKVEMEKREARDELMPVKEMSLSSLVKSVKAKTQQFQTKKKKK